MNASWHKDPAGGQFLRLWDGRQWTNRTAPLPAQSPRPIAQVVGHQGPKHVMHAILTVMTFGAYLPVWLLIAMSNKQTPRYAQIAQPQR